MDPQSMPPCPLESQLTIYEVGELKPKLLAWLAQPVERFEIDLAGIESIDAAGLQLLMLLKHECSERQKALCLCNHSAAVLALFDQLNVAAFFGDPLILPAEDAN